MPGTGSGPLQPTKLIQTDDFMETIAPPGYYSKYVLCADASIADSSMPNPAAVLVVVPDGMKAQIIDAGFTWPHAFTFTGSNKVALEMAVMDSDGTASKQLITSFERITAVTAGLTISTGRTIPWNAAAATEALREVDAGSIISVGINASGTTGAGANFIAWVRIKWNSKDTGNI